MRPVLVLRPEPGATATADRARDGGLRPIAAPLFRIDPVAWEAPDPAGFDAVLLTSANAVRHAGDALRDYEALPVWAVGAATGDVAREAGLWVADVGEADAATLLGLMAASGPRSVLHLAGAEHRAIDAPGLRITRRIVYRAEAATKLPPAAADAIAAGCVALVHSPRAAALLDRLTTGPRGRTALLAISDAALRAGGAGWASGRAAPMPTDAAMLAVAAQLCEEAA